MNREILTNPHKTKAVISIARRLLALLSSIGVAISLVIYVASFGALTLDRMGNWIFVLHIGIFFLLIAMYAIEYSAIRNRTFFWDGFKRGKPAWSVPSIQFLGLFFIIHFVLFLVLSHAASPEIMNGQYVLNDHGQIRKILTESEYLSLKGSELRIFATGWMFFYFASTMYWWFPRWKGTPDQNQAK